MPDVVLHLSGVAKSFPDGSGTRLVVEDAALTVQAGSMVAVTGPSGCGKTTLLGIASGLLRPDRGSVAVVGRVLGGLGRPRWRRCGATTSV